MSAVRLRRIDPARNMRRFYLLDVQPDLFGAWCLIREWGRIGRAGQCRAVPSPTEIEARAALPKQLRRKQRGDTGSRRAASGAIDDLPLP